MPRPIPAVRLLPMSDRQPGFRGLSIEQVQRHFFLDRLPKRGGRWRYHAAGLSADPYTVVLFQFRARAIAMASFLRDEKPDRGAGGTLVFDPESFATFEPVDADGMRRAWPGFRSFGHVKQVLNAEGFATFRRQLKHVVRACA